MSEPVPSPEPSEGRRRPAVIAAAAAVLVALGLLGAAAAWLPLGAFELLARGLEGTRPRVEAAFAEDVPESLRAQVRDEIREQASWLRGLDARELDPEAARTAALGAEGLVRLLRDERLDRSEARFFVEQSRRLRVGRSGDAP